MIRRDDLVNRLKKEVLRANGTHKDIQSGYTGKMQVNGTVNPNPSDGLATGKVWVRLESNSLAIVANNITINNMMPNIPVWVGISQRTGEWEVMGVNDAAIAELGDIASTLNTPNRVGALVGEVTDPNWLSPLRVYPDDGINFGVAVDAGLFYWQGSLHYFAGGTLDISASKPTSVFGTKRPVLIGIDPATDTLVAYAGTTVLITAAPVGGKLITTEHIYDTIQAATAGIYWIACVPLLSTESDWVDHFRVTALQFVTREGVASLDDIGDVDTTGVLDGDVLTYDSGTSTWIAAPPSGGGGHEILVNDTPFTQRAGLNFIDGNGIDITGNDDAGDNETEVAITVNQGEIDLANLGTKDFVDLDDTPASITANRFLVGNSAGTALEFNPDVEQDQTNDAVVPVTDFDANLGWLDKRYRNIYTMILQGYNYVPPLIDTTNGRYFDDNSATYPPEFTETTAASTSDTDTPPAFWRVIADTASTGWDYSFQTHQSIEGLAANGYFGIIWDTLCFLDAKTTNTHDWYFGLYRDNAGIDTTTFVRANVQWDSVGLTWRVRGQYATGGAITNGTWKTLNINPLSPFTLRTSIRNGTTGTGRVYLSDENWHNVGFEQLLNANITQTWGTVWARLHMVKATGQAAVLRWGGYDFTSAA